MTEHMIDSGPSPTHIEQQRSAEMLAVLPQQEQGQTQNTANGMLAAEQAAHVTALLSARESVGEASAEQELRNTLDSLDLSPGKFNLTVGSSYRAEAESYDKSGNSMRISGERQGGEIAYYDGIGPATNKWAKHRDQKISRHEPVEQVGIRKSSDRIWTTEKQIVTRPGLRGKLGFKHEKQVSYFKSVEPTYTFDYEFAAPAVTEDKAAKAIGNNTGQSIRLSLEISKEQAESLSKILAEDPKAARTVLNSFMEKTGDSGAWNAEIFDEDGNFYDPGKRYDKELLARDVRPNYDAMPSLNPEVIDLLSVPEQKQAATPNHYLPPAA